jgi:hypothetical protein
LLTQGLTTVGKSMPRTLLHQVRYRIANPLRRPARRVFIGMDVAHRGRFGVAEDLGDGRHVVRVADHRDDVWRRSGWRALLAHNTLSVLASHAWPFGGCATKKGNGTAVRSNLYIAIDELPQQTQDYGVPHERESPRILESRSPSRGGESRVPCC